MQLPEKTQVQKVYGAANVKSSIKMITLAPELVGSTDAIESLTQEHGVTVSLGHSAADFETGLQALKSGAKSLTHVFNAMAPFGHRLPGLAGLIGNFPGPYYSIIPDGIHIHPTVVSMAFRANPEKCILITDSIEMAGMPDGLYPGHAQIPHMQRKVGNRVTIDGTDTLIGSCIGLDECVRNLRLFSGCSLAEAVRCVTENVASLMGLQDRGVIAKGRRADLAVLDQNGYVQGLWSRGRKVFNAR